MKLEEPAKFNLGMIRIFDAREITNARAIQGTDYPFERKANEIRPP
jgi:hypothetical protein